MVGVHKSYPNQNYKVALWELADPYLIPKLTASFDKEVKEEDLLINKRKESSRFNSGFISFIIIPSIKEFHVAFI